MTKAFRLHDYQSEIVARIHEAWQSHRAVMVQMPTGTGKTHVLASLVNEKLRIKNEEFRQSVKEIWIVAHRRELVTQIEETLERYGIGRKDGRIKVVSIQWLSKHWEDVDGKPGLVIIDEAHHALAETYRMLWERCPQARFLGLTATPCRMNGRGFTDLFDTLVTSWSIAEFIEKRYLSAFDYVSIRPGSEEQRLVDSLEKRGADGDYQVKEMDSVLNHNTSIERLYGSMMRFAGGKKGIVYAISIDHARRIAEYYSGRGVNAVPIDSRTPAVERKRMVKEFRAGKIQVLVNVDIFSEGFDCPDVEFVQMARPTLSLSKYLQQVGRGLRKVKGKESCVLIDNVGLYRVFGLPTVAWDWEAMFRGTMSGKGVKAASQRSDTGMTVVRDEPEGVREEGMEVIVSHEQLLENIASLKDVRPVQTDSRELKAWRDVESGLWGLRRGRNRTTEATFVEVFDIRYDMAAVSFKDKDCGIVNDAGEVVWKTGGCRSVGFLKDRLLLVKTCRKKYYVDLCSLRTYMRKPRVKRYGNVELLETDDAYYSRTKTVYVNSQGVDRRFIHWRKFYLTIYDEKVPFPGYYNGNRPSECYAGHACILEGDNESYYWLYHWLADGSIIIMDNARQYYHAAEGQAKRYIGCRNSEEEWCRCKVEIERIAREAEQEWQADELRRAEMRRQQLAQSDDAVPFQSGVRWGLRVGSRITIPPIYRKVKSPVGKYCAVEKNYSQWGVVGLDGTVMVEPKYSDIEISLQGIVTGTKVTGVKEQVRLP